MARSVSGLQAGGGGTGTANAENGSRAGARWDQGQCHSAYWNAILSVNEGQRPTICMTRLVHESKLNSLCLQGFCELLCFYNHLGNKYSLILVLEAAASELFSIRPLFNIYTV